MLARWVFVFFGVLVLSHMAESSAAEKGQSAEDIGKIEAETADRALPRHRQNIFPQFHEQAFERLIKIEVSDQYLKDRIEDQNSRISDMEWLIALVGIGFGALVTTVVVFFALRVASEAKAEAQIAAVEEARKAISNIKAEIDGEFESQLLNAKEKLDEEIIRLLEEAELSVNALQVVREAAEEDGNKVSVILQDIQSEAQTDAAASEEGASTAAQSGSGVGDAFSKGSEAFEDQNFAGAEAYFDIAEDEAGSETQKLRAIINRATSLSYGGAPEGAVVILEKLIEDYSSNEDDDVAEILVTAKYFNGLNLRESGENLAAIDVLQEVFDKNKSSDNVEITRIAVNALVSMAATHLLERNKSSEIDTYELLIDTFKDIEDSKIECEVIRARLNRIGVLEDELPKKEIILELSGIIETYSDSENEDVQGLLHRATSLMQKYDPEWVYIANA